VAAQLGLPVKIAVAEYTFDGQRLTLLYVSDEKKLELGELLRCPRGFAPDRPARPGQTDGGLRRLWRVALLFPFPLGVQPHLHQNGQDAGDVA
jgi:hypothetical protein